MSVKITVDDTKLQSLINNTGTKAKYIVADGVSYGIHNEFGTVKMSAHPFMRPAVEAVRGGFVQALKGNLTGSLFDAVLRKAAYDVQAGAQERARVDTGAMKNSIHVVKGDKFTFHPQK